MDSTLPVAVPPFKSRRGWLIAFGVVEILMGFALLLMILLSAFVFFGPAAAQMPPGATPAGPISRPVLMALVALQYGLMAAVFFAGGIGSIRCKNWARILMLVVSGFWLFCGALGTVTMAFIFPFIMRQQSANVPPGIQNAILAGMIAVMAFLGILLPATFLFFYTRKGVKATCLGRKAGISLGPESVETSGFPVLLAIVGSWEALSALSVLAVLFVRAVLVFGILLHGVAALLVFLTHSILSACAAWLIFKQNVLGWKIALFKSAFWALSMLIVVVHPPDMMAFFNATGASEQNLRIYEQFPQMLSAIWIGTAVMMTVLIIILLYARKSFPKEG